MKAKERRKEKLGIIKRSIEGSEHPAGKSERKNRYDPCGVIGRAPFKETNSASAR